MAEKTTEIERIYTIPLRKTKDLTRSRRAQLAVRDVQRYLVRHLKADRVWVDNTVNEELWSRGKFRIPSRIRVRAIRFSDGVVEVTLPESTTAGSVRDQLKERREKAIESPVLKAPEAGDAGPGADRPVTDVKGVGPATAEKLDKAGITTVGELAAADVAEVAEASGISADKVTQYSRDAKELLAGGEPAGAGDAEAKDGGDEPKADAADAKPEPKEAKPAAKSAKGDDQGAPAESGKKA